ncbi:Uncharacterised protein [Chromobacterium violaceum]|uniref:DUF2147 domain-containing protein n=1 Tax=Chromobacterium violaceum TaxID=536 RepID=A0A3S4LKP4_CHRVL|nr:Uncharacterised protein [Chromobacterium violaceum]
MKMLCKSTMCLAALTVAAIAHAGAICDGQWALITVYTCDGGPMGGTSKCMLLGRDANLDGKWDEGTTSASDWKMDRGRRPIMLRRAQTVMPIFATGLKRPSV